MALACPGLRFVTLTPAALGLSNAPNPFSLEPQDSAEVAVLSNSFCDWLNRTKPDCLGSVLKAAARAAGVVVGLDSADQFSLSFPPQVVAQLALVIKGQGVFIDRDLYNYEVGPVYEGAIWAKKRNARKDRYSDAELGRIRLSLPCFALHLPGLQRAARRRERSPAFTARRKMTASEFVVRNAAEPMLLAAADLTSFRRDLDVHCAMGLTHVQRLEAIEQLAGLSGTRGITSVPEAIFGTSFGPQLPAAEREAIVARAEPYRLSPVGRLRYLREMRRHRVIVAPTGYGELTFRHGEALRAGAALVCQDLRHVETMFPLRPGENCVFCRPDLSDLRSKVQGLLADASTRKSIAREGHHGFADWSANWRTHLRSGIERHILEALNITGR